MDFLSKIENEYHNFLDRNNYDLEVFLQATRGSPKHKEKISEFKTIFSEIERVWKEKVDIYIESKTPISHILIGEYPNIARNYVYSIPEHEALLKKHQIILIDCVPFPGVKLQTKDQKKAKAKMVEWGFVNITLPKIEYLTSKLGSEAMEQVRYFVLYQRHLEDISKWKHLSQYIYPTFESLKIIGNSVMDRINYYIALYI